MSYDQALEFGLMASKMHSMRRLTCPNAFWSQGRAGAEGFWADPEAYGRIARKPALGLAGRVVHPDLLGQPPRLVVGLELLAACRVEGHLGG